MYTPPQRRLKRGHPRDLISKLGIIQYIIINYIFHL